MKYVTLIASETVNGVKVELAKQERFPIAETIQDIIAMVDEDNGWNLEETISAFNAGSRVKRQTQLRTGAEAPTNVKLFKGLSQSKQEEILRQHGLI